MACHLHGVKQSSRDSELCLNSCHKRPFILSDLSEFDCWCFSIVVDLFIDTVTFGIRYSEE